MEHLVLVVILVIVVVVVVAHVASFCRIHPCPPFYPHPHCTICIMENMETTPFCPQDHHDVFTWGGDIPFQVNLLKKRNKSK